MNWFTLIKRYYDAGLYTNADVAVFTEAGKITPEQYETITGEPWSAGEEA